MGKFRKLAFRKFLLLVGAPAIPYGGQAAIEGVMMKGTGHAALAVRRSDKRIEVLEREVKSRFPHIVKLPFLRGFFILWDMMTLGMWALRESSHRYEIDLDAEEARKQGKEVPKEEAAGSPDWVQTVMLVVSLIIALLMFKVLPAAGASGVFVLFGWIGGEADWLDLLKGGPLAQMAENPGLAMQFTSNIIEGLIKLSIFVGYIWLVGKLKEIQRVFQYHGAEHIVINAYEDDAENQSIPFIQEHSTAHPRCGTSFIVILILASIVLFTLFDWALVSWLPADLVHGIPVWYIRWPLRILALPLLAGLSYEVVKAAFKYYSNPLLRPLLRFGMLFQTLTTRKPDDGQVAVSLASFNRARFLTEGIAEPPIQIQ